MSPSLSFPTLIPYSLPYIPTISLNPTPQKPNIQNPMIEPVAATALILSILALIAYYLQPQQPHHQRHYYHQIRRARVMADPQRLRRGSDVDRGGEGRGGGEGEVYEREHEEGEGEDEGRGEVAIGVREGNLIWRRLGLEGGVDVGHKKEAGAAVDSVLKDASTHKLKTHAAIDSQASTVPAIRITVPDSDIPSTILPIHDAEHRIAPESCCYSTLDQQRRQRVRFDKALRMHSYGGSQYVGRVVDRDV